ncbi:hypothetical protein EBS40_09740, partial [bacterium]|nr:hypothetical protein [bacterium]
MRMLLTFLLAICTWGAMAQSPSGLKIDITTRGDKLIPVAMPVPVAEDRLRLFADTVQEVVGADLRRTGAFGYLAPNGLPPTAESVAQTPELFKGWKARGAEALVASSLTPLADGRVELRFRLLDTKTGKSAADFLQAHAVQLWLYASAPLCADGPAGDADFEVSDFVPMHRVDQSTALVAHLPMEGEASIIGIDIAAGRECFERVIRPTWAWRSRSDLRVDDWQTPPLATNLLDRLRTIAAMSPDVAQRVREVWPSGCPKLSEGGHTAEQLAQIQQIVEQAEALISAPFADLPTEPAPLRHAEVAEVRVRVVPDEGGDADEVIVQQLREMYAALTDDQRSWIAWLADQSRHVATFHMAERKTLRTTRIVRGLVTLAAHDCMDQELVRAAAAFALDSDEPLQAPIPPGAAIAVMDYIEAGAFAAAC